MKMTLANILVFILTKKKPVQLVQCPLETLTFLKTAQMFKGNR